MRIGLFNQIQVPKPWTSSTEAQRIYEALEQIPCAEEQGFESVWLPFYRGAWRAMLGVMQPTLGRNP